MGERSKYTPGTFSWTDLTTTDQDAAKSFYGELFGWQANDLPMGDEGTYSMMQLDGKNVAAISPQPPQQREQGVPPVWNSYVTVESADRTLERAKELGGTVHADAFDVFDAGRMGVIQDPQGAFVLAWEPKSNIGAQLVNANGALSWNELATTDTDAAAKFYGELFGWKTESFEGTGMPYMTIQTSDGHGNGGIRQKMDQEPVPFWLVYFGAEDIDATFGKVKELGGNQLAEPMEIGEMGKIAVVQDPHGAVFALYSGRFED